VNSNLPNEVTKLKDIMDTLKAKVAQKRTSWDAKSEFNFVYVPVATSTE
jgi:hypothetical protein